MCEVSLVTRWNFDEPLEERKFWVSYVNSRDLETFRTFKSAFKLALYKRVLGQLFIPVVILQPRLGFVEYGLNFRGLRLRDQLTLRAIRNYIDDDDKFMNLANILVDKVLFEFMKLEVPDDKT